MRVRVVLLLGVAAATALVASVSTLAQSGPPNVGYYTPSTGPVGTAVMLYGNLPSDTSVYFNGAYASNRAWIDSGRIQVIVPGGATTGPLTVGNSFGTTSPGTFVVTAGTPPPIPPTPTPQPTPTPTPAPPTPSQPVVGYYTPSTGLPGTVVMLYGNLPSDTSVYFNGVYASDRTWIDSGRIRVVVPGGATTGPLTVGNSLGTTSPGTFYVPTPTPTPTPVTLTRYSVGSPAGNALLPSVRQGVEVMQSRSASDPTSWAFQAAIHGYVSGIPQAGWGSCQHQNLNFLSWHRMYLYYFERILRRASGHPSLTLPYWNYADAAQRALPLSFRAPTVGNALYVSDRSAAMNQGGQLTAAAVSHTGAFAQTTFTNFSLASNGIERQPHNIVHTVIGGWMGDPDTAAQDPIFWLHHANIDRLWKRWLDQGAGRANPTTNSAWMNTPFTFYDENGTRVTMTGSQILTTVRQLGYRYDDDTNLNGRVADGLVADETSAALAATVTPAPPEELASLEQVLDVGGIAVRVDVPLPLQATEKLSSVAARTSAGRVVLTLDGIEFEKNTGLYYEVYVNLPSGVAPDWQGPHFVGTMALFGLKPHGAGHAGHAASAALTFDATAAVQRTGGSGAALSVTIVPRGPLAPNGKAAPIPANVTRVKINRIRLSSE